MDSTPSSQIRLSKVISQFIEAKKAQCLSKNTLIDYSRTYKKLCSFLVDDRYFTEITATDIRQFINSQSHLSKKTRLNIHIGLSSMWKWAVDEELCTINIMRKIQRPRPEKRAIIPFSRTEIEQIFASLDPESLRYKRDRAILLVLLDTGMRASELCTLKNSGLSGMKMVVYGKGDKERVLPMSSITYQALSEYLRADDRENLSRQEYLFLTYRKKSFRGDDLYHMITKLGEEVGIKANPHKFRHTFAINFLRNGGNIFALQEMLGHESLDMVRRYLKIAEADVEAVHRRASPVARWEL